MTVRHLGGPVEVESVQFVVPYWGDAGVFQQTLASLAAQTDPDWSCLIIDDGYPDDTIRRQVESGADPRLSYLRNAENLGVAGNFERCRQRASADLIVFLGCDDLLEPGYVARVRQLAGRFPAASMIQPGVRVMDGSGAIVRPLGDAVKTMMRPGGRTPRLLAGEELAVSLLRGNWLYWPSLVFRREAIAALPFDLSLATILDLDLVLRLLVRGSSLVLDDEPVFRYRRHTGSASSRTLMDGTRFAEDRRWFRAAERLCRRHGWPRAERAARWRLTSRLHGATLLPAALRARDPRGARTALVHVLTPAPRRGGGRGGGAGLS